MSEQIINHARRRIALIGAGDMGGAIAETLLRVGLDVIVYDARPEIVEALAMRGCRAADSVRSAAEAADLVLVVVSNDQQVLSVANEVAGASPAPRVVVIQSTVHPSTVQLVQSILAVPGIGCLDAPVTGGSAAARNAVLTTFVGGELDDLEYVRPVLDAYCRSVRRVGAIGAGQLTKITNNVMSIVNTMVALEALAIAKAAGLEEGAVRAAIVEGGTGSSRALAGTDANGFGTPWERRQALDKDAKAGDPGLAKKDLGHAVTLAEADDVSVPLLKAALDVLGRR